MIHRISFGLTLKFFKQKIKLPVLR